MSAKLNLRRMNIRQRYQEELDTPCVLARLEEAEEADEDFRAFVVGSLSAAMVALNIRSRNAEEPQETAH